MKFAKKSLGQNFLIDKNIIRKIINLTDFKNKDVIEIGPGKGAITEEILKNDPRYLSIIEKDNNLANILKKKYNKNNLVKVYKADILKINLEILTKKKFYNYWKFTLQYFFSNFSTNIKIQKMASQI